jgi:hypothetical protein
MSTKQLSEVITSGGIRSINFFNGRLLTAEDMTAEQTTRRAADARLGKALGAGIAYGLEVTQSVANATAPIVTVQPGLAISASGQALSLSEAADVALARPPVDFSPATGAVFKDCQPPQPGTYLVDEGVYLLVMSPASATEGRAPVNGLGTCSDGCNAAYKVEGVQFRLVPLSPASDLTQPALLRNSVAYECFGYPGDTDALVGNPFSGTSVRTGLLDVMLRNKVGIGPCDVPLAVLFWTLPGIQYIDMWSVRRRVTEPDPSLGWPFLFGARRVSEAHAMIQQFQDQVDDAFDNENDLSGVKAADRFAYLPPAGLLPVQSFNSPKGFNPAIFFGDQASKSIATMDGAGLRPLFSEALSHEPIEVGAGAKIQLYVTFENYLAVQAGVVSQLTVIFASKYLTSRETARFNLASFASGRFASNLFH